jgi:hypothetical protein
VKLALVSRVTLGIGEGFADDDAAGDGDGEVDAAGDTECDGNPTPLVNASNARTIGKINDATALGLLSISTSAPMSSEAAVARTA